MREPFHTKPLGNTASKYAYVDELHNRQMLTHLRFLAATCSQVDATIKRSRCMTLEEPETNMAEWGWSMDDIGELRPISRRLLKVYRELKKCSFKELCTSENCACKTYILPCAGLCACHGPCEN